MFSQNKIDICRQAEVLRPPANKAYEKEKLCVYLIGDLDPNRMGQLMYHNKINHQCTVVDQCSELVKLFHSRPDFTEAFDQAAFLTETLNTLEKYEAVDRALGIVPCATCRNNWDTLEQVDDLFDVMALCGPRPMENTRTATKRPYQPS
ncbi:hypothetical protein CAEBREN_21474 [Caenorhabditis brenneri]|uniref:Uncharacterized protein n=1 Tax=Caenorhabditis brenneri TaxID=135651 RepID=G0MYJ0_CAEBE|nr:hypothetical protein CAEBREN_21474 [Caenorhabditis brenneri]